jgi:hypothetical protein
MNRHNAQILFNPDNNPFDISLNNIRDILSNNYWANPTEGVFSFDFNTTTFTNTTAPFYFSLSRFTPTYQYDAFRLTIPGFVENDGSIVYGGGRTGRLVEDQIIWNDNKSWKMIDKVPSAETPLLSLDYVLDQSTVDSNVMGNIVQNKYYM